MSTQDRRELQNIADQTYAASYESETLGRFCSSDGSEGLQFRDQDPSSITMLYASADSPVFHKAYFPSLYLPYSVSNDARRGHIESFIESSFHVDDRFAASLAEGMQDAKNAYFEAQPPDAPKDAIHVLGLFAIHDEVVYEPVQIVEGWPAVHIPYSEVTSVVVAPTPFLEAYQGEVPFGEHYNELVADIDTPLAEQFLREMYAIQSEHDKTGDRDFESFRARFEGTDGPDGLDPAIVNGRNMAIVALSFAMFPAKLTQPVLQKRLFGK